MMAEDAPLTAMDAPPVAEEGAPTIDRRSWLRSGLAAAAGMAAAGAVPQQAAAQGSAGRYGAVFNQLNQQLAWRSPELRLLRRISLGMTEGEVARITQIGYSAYLEEQMAWERLDDSACDTHLANGYRDFLSIPPRDAMLLSDAMNNFDRVIRPYQRVAVEQAILTKRQLLERMVEFWGDHFNVYIWSAYGLRPYQERQAIRPNALTTVGALVRATMRSPAMLYYLDQVWNTRWGINENYARELMELHTVGVDGGYTQRDVYELARVLTGWSVDNTGAFVYNANNHDFGSKEVFGMSFPATTPGRGTAGMEEGIAFGEHLIRHANTKRYIATKLLKWFVTPQPTNGQIQEVIRAYGDQGDIKAMLRVVLSPANLLRAPAKLKRPFHFVVSGARATGATVKPMVDPRRDNDGILWALGTLGHSPGNWSTPDGYPDREDYWAGAIVDRWNQTNQFVQNWNTGNGATFVDFSRFMGDGSIDGVVQQVNRQLFGGEMSADLAVEIRNVLRSGVTLARVQTAVRLAIMAPEFQFC